MEPVTMIVMALAAGAAAAVKPTAEQAVKDAYAGLKALIVRKYSRASASVEALETAPESKNRRGVVEEDLAQTEAALDADVRQQAQVLLDAIQKNDPGVARVVGVDLEDIRAAMVKLANIEASGAGSVTGVRVKGADVQRDIDISGVRATGSTDPKA